MEELDVKSKRLAYFSLGSNLGNRMANLKQGIDLLNESYSFKIASHIIETQSWGYEDPNPYLNMVVCFALDSSASEIRNRISEIEKIAGREPRDEGEGYAARTLDVDLLYLGNEICEDSTIQVPHPRLHLRNFVLEPLVQIAPDYMHPILNKTNKELLALSPDESQVVHVADGV